MKMYNVNVSAIYHSIILSTRTGLFTEQETVDAIQTVWQEAFVGLKRRGVFDWKDKRGDLGSLHGFDFRVYVAPVV